MAKSNKQITEAEWAILQTVWELEPCAAPAVQEALVGRRKWAYSTVKTIMDRMAAKGLLKTEKIRKLILYTSAITRTQAQKGEVMNTIKRAFNGAMTPMMQFLLEDGDLSSAELGELESLIRKKRKRSGKGAKR